MGSFASGHIKQYAIEQCDIRLPFALEGTALFWNDYLRNCRCNEYVAGIKHYYADNYMAGSTIRRPVKMLQLRCCWSGNVEQIPPSCVYSGMDTLQAPWNLSSIGVRSCHTSPRGTTRRHAPPIVLSILKSDAAPPLKENNINARLCNYATDSRYYQLPDYGNRGCYSGVDWDCTENLDQGGTCYDSMTSVYGWTKNIFLAYDNERNVASFKNDVVNDRTIQICRYGYRLLSLQKRVLQDKRFTLDISCVALTSRPC
uniref:Uncharacterized protein n=1 Tax=Romanomermis culicivorax TaxID=13658 RepID=A0A915L3U0_ROMCU